MCDLAIADITKAIEYNPKFANHYLLRGSAFYRKDDYTAAIADYTKAIEINPQSPLLILDSVMLITACL